MRDRRLLRALIAISTVLAVALIWLAPARAWAAPTSRAPLCDPRGAVMFAPPPQMQDVESSLDTGLTLEDCLAGLGQAGSDAGRAAPGRAPVSHDGLGSFSDAALLAAAALLVPCARERLAVPDAISARARPGHHTRVDRPPRA